MITFGHLYALNYDTLLEQNNETKDLVLGDVGKPRGNSLPHLGLFRITFPESWSCTIQPYC